MPTDELADCAIQDEVATPSTKTRGSKDDSHWLMKATEKFDQNDKWNSSENENITKKLNSFENFINNSGKYSDGNTNNNDWLSLDSDEDNSINVKQKTVVCSIL